VGSGVHKIRVLVKTPSLLWRETGQRILSALKGRPSSAQGNALCIWVKIKNFIVAKTLAGDAPFIKGGQGGFRFPAGGPIKIERFEINRMTN